MKLLALAVAALSLAAVTAQAEPIDVTSRTIDRFDLATPAGSRYDKLIFLGGLQLDSSEKAFGGLSGLRVSADGSRFTAISDRGNWFTGEIRYDGSKPVGVAGVDMTPTPGRDGRPLAGKRGFDTEALEIEGRTAWVSAERANWLTRYTLDADGKPSGKGVAVTLPKAMAGAPFNQGFEAMAAMSSGVIIIMIAEKYLNDEGDNRGFVVGGKAPFEFAVKRTDDFSPTDLVRLPSGDFVLLERRYKPPFSLATRMRKLAAKDIAAGATVDGPVLMQATLAQAIDNFEAIAVHRGPDGGTVLTILADDNFSFLERILLMQFALPD